MTHSVIICLGSNYGDRTWNIRLAIRSLTKILEGEILVSELIESPSETGIGFPYFNAVMTGKTEMEYERLHNFCKHIESKAGRTPDRQRAGEIVLDVDIVVFDGTVMKEAEYYSCYFKKCIGHLKAMPD